MILRVGSVLLVLWGLVNGVGGALGAREHPAPWIGSLFLCAGVLISWGGIGFWHRARWTVWLTVAGLLSLSAVALVSGYILRGPSDMRISHHLLRLALSALIFSVAAVGLRRDPRERVHPQADRRRPVQ